MPTNLELFESDFDLIILTLDLPGLNKRTYNGAVLVANDWVLDDAVVIGRQLYHVSGRLHDLASEYITQLSFDFTRSPA